MAADSILKLPGKFEAGKSYLLEGKTLIAWRDALLADRVVPGAGLKETGTPQGRILSAAQLIEKHQFDIYEMVPDALGAWSCKVRPGYVLTINPEPGPGEPVMSYIPVTGTDVAKTITAASKIYVKVTTNAKDVATAAEIVVLETAPTDAHAQPDPGAVTGVYHYRIADFESVDGAPKIATRYHLGGPIIHRPGRNNRNLKIIIEQRSLDFSEGRIYSAGPDEFMYFRQGNYVGTTTPWSTAVEDLKYVTHLVG